MAVSGAILSTFVPLPLHMDLTPPSSNNLFTTMNNPLLATLLPWTLKLE